MQKLEERNTYTPTDIPHVRGNCDLTLNREETLSVSGLKTSSNIPDAALIGQFRTGTGLVSTCCKTEHLLTEKHDIQLSSKLVILLWEGGVRSSPF
ncbi:MAG: hypothetical protein OI715_00800 (plasmid) [Candidatus Methanoperedens sp.]|nr:MAG: hypothetical protein OI715_00800 [Candidatus Methanoperedens sp.]